MSYFQNPFAAEYQGAWLLDDRQYSPTFLAPRNFGRGDENVIAYGVQSTYDLSGNDADGNANRYLKIRYALNGNFLNWNELTIDLTAGSALTPEQIVTTLNASSTFATFFTATFNKPYIFGTNDYTEKRRYKNAFLYCEWSS